MISYRYVWQWCVHFVQHIECGRPRLFISPQMEFDYYTPIAFDERVTFWLQRNQSLSCAFAALYACAIA